MLLMKKTITLTSTPTPTPPPSNSSVPVGGIIGGVFGGLALLAGIICLAWYMTRIHGRHPTTQVANIEHFDLNSGGPGRQEDMYVKEAPVSSEPKHFHKNQNNLASGRLSQALVYPDTLDSGNTRNY
jgi:hypothetical protein